jgi:hypothetical protein
VNDRKIDQAAPVLRMDGEDSMMTRFCVCALVLSAGLSAGCTVDATDAGADVAGAEGVGSIESEIGETSCTTAKADFVLRLSWNRGEILTTSPSDGVATPTTYDNPGCDKAYVIDIQNNPFHDFKSNIPMQLVYNGPRIKRLGVDTNEIAADQATCQSIKMRAIRYEPVIQIGGFGWRVIDNLVSSATFIPIGGPPPFPNQPQPGICYVPPPIPLSATPPGLGQKLTVQAIKTGGVTISVKLKAR